ncbi:reverse transcriptase domain-containing protein [Tanacetum coccineum]
MIKEHDQQAKIKATPRKLVYADSNKEASAKSLAKGFFDRFSLESSGTSDTHRQTRSTSKSQKTPSKNKEPTHLRRSIRLEDQSTTKEKARRERSKSREKRSRHQEISSDSEHEEGLEDAYKDLNSPYKRPKPTPFTQRITRFKYHRRAILPRNIRVYEGNKDPEDHLGIFSAAVEQEEWLMPVWCKMFGQTLGGAAQNWFDDLDPKSVDSFGELSQKFLEEFSQQKIYAKDMTEIYGIKRRQNEGLQAFMDRFKSESSHIKGVPPVLSISAFMHGHGHPELAKKLNDKIPKTADEMFERVRAFIRGEVATRSAEMVRPSQGDKGYVRLTWSGVPEKARNRGGPRKARRNMGVYTPYPKKDTFTPLIKTLKEILAMESVSFLEPPPLIGTPEKQNLNKFCDYHGDRDHNTNDCYQLKKQIEEAVASGKLAHLVKDIRQNNQRNMNQGRDGMKVINMIREEGNRKRSFEEGRSGLMSELTFLAIPRSQLTNEPIILEGIIEGNQVRRIVVDSGSSSEIMYEHCFRNLDINIRSRLKRIREQVILRARINSRRRPSSGLVSLEKTQSKEDVEEVFTISHERPDQHVTMGATLTTNCKQLLADILRKTWRYLHGPDQKVQSFRDLSWSIN